MERRDFLTQLATVAATASAGLSGCQHLGAHHKGKLDLDAVTAWLAKMDQHIQNMSILPHKKDPATLQKVSMLRDIMSSLTFASALRDIPESQRSDPRLQKVFEEKMPHVSQTIFRVATMLESLTPKQQKEFQAQLKGSTAVDHFLTTLASRRGEAGVSAQRVALLEKLTGQVTWRLKNQNPGLLIQECVSRVDRVAARYKITPAQRRVYAGTGLPNVRVPNPMTRGKKNGAKLMRTGGILIGIALGLGLLGLLLFITPYTAIIGAILGPTLGGILLIVGLVFVVVGLAIQ